MSENLPSDVDGSRGWFDRLAARASGITSRAWWFSFSVVMVIAWAVSGPFVHFSSTWQLIINTGTTILTFLLVGLAANTESRDNTAIQVKLNAIADALADALDDDHPDDARELRRAVGLEDRTSS